MSRRSVRGVVDGSRYGGRRGNYAVLSGIESDADQRAIPRDRLRNALARLEGGTEEGEEALRKKLVQNLLCVRTFHRSQWDARTGEYDGGDADAPGDEQIDHWLKHARLRKVGDKFEACGTDDDVRCTEPITRDDLIAEPYTRSGFKGVSSRTWLPRRRPPGANDEEGMRRAHGKNSTRAQRWIGYYTRFRDKDEESKQLRMNRALLGMFHHKFFAVLAHALAEKVYHRDCLRDGEGKERACGGLVHAGFSIKRLMQLMDRCHLARRAANGVPRDEDGEDGECSQFYVHEDWKRDSSARCDGYVSVDMDNLEAALRPDEGGEEEGDDADVEQQGTPPRGDPSASPRGDSPADEDGGEGSQINSTADEGRRTPSPDPVVPTHVDTPPSSPPTPQTPEQQQSSSRQVDEALGYLNF